MTDFHCDNCEFLQDKSNDNLIDGYCKKYNQSLTFYDWFEKCDKCLIETLQSENASLRARLEKAVELPFIVIDKKTGKEADEYEIALHEDWAKHLMYCDMEGFAIEQDGTLMLLDECGQFIYCSSDRFEVVSEARLAELKGEKK